MRKRGRVYEYFFEGAKVNDKRTRISKSGFRTKNEAYLVGQKAYDEYVLNQALLKSYQKTGTKESLRNYQKVIKSSLRDAANYFGYIEVNPAGNLQIPRVLSFEPKKKGIKHVYTKEEIEKFY